MKYCDPKLGHQSIQRPLGIWKYKQSKPLARESSLYHLPLNCLESDLQGDFPRVHQWVKLGICTWPRRVRRTEFIVKGEWVEAEGNLSLERAAEAWVRFQRRLGRGEHSCSRPVWGWGAWWLTPRHTCLGLSVPGGRSKGREKTGTRRFTGEAG